MNFPRALVVFCLGLVIGFSSIPAQADGCYMPLKVVRNIPPIQAQCALLQWKEGTETLVIASSLDSESQALGWIIPLPSVPSKIEKADPGLLKTLSFCVQPKITHSDQVPVFPALFLSLLTVLIVATAIYNRGCLGRILIYGSLIILLLGLLCPVMSSVSSGTRTMIQGVTVEKTAMVGAYSIQILSAKSSADLDSWLDQNGFKSFPEAARSIISNYISKNWVFAAIKLVRDMPGANTPHPIRMTFRANRAVYPLQLTALAGSPPSFELFVLGDQRAQSDRLKTGFCDQYQRDGEYEKRTGFSGVYQASNSLERIGNPELTKYFWNGCVLTKLSGTLNPEQMADDLAIQWTPYRPFLQHFYTKAGAYAEAALWFLIAFSGFICVSMVAYRKILPTPEGHRWWVAKRAMPALVIITVPLAVFLCFAPILPPGESTVFSRHASIMAIGAIRGALDHTPELLEKSEAELAQIVIEELKSYNLDRNRIMGGELLAESSPGNFTLEKHGARIEFCVYDETGTPRKFEVEPEEVRLKRNKN